MENKKPSFEDILKRRIMGDVFSGNQSRSNFVDTVNQNPQVNLYEDDLGYNLLFCVPGLESGDVKIDICEEEERGKYLLVVLNKAVETELHTKKREFSLGYDFSDRYDIPEGVSDHPVVRLQDGILQITLIKTTEEQKPLEKVIRQLEINQ